MLRTLLSHCRDCFRREDGISLIMSIGVLGVLSLSGVTMVSYANGNARAASFSDRNSKSYAVAEAGLNEAMAILAYPKNNPLNPYLLGAQLDGTVVAQTRAYEGGTTSYWGVLDQATATWTLTAVGRTKNPTGTAANVERKLTAKVPVTPPPGQPLSNPAWNYIYATRTGNTCDMTLEQSVAVASPLYVRGNLCLQNTASITRGPLVVKGRLTLSQNANSVGSAAAPINEAHIGLGCVWKANPLRSPCSSADNVFATVVSATPPEIAAPAVDWDAWYLNASPGPYYPCHTKSGTVPVFDTDQGSPLLPDPTKRNASVIGSFNLTQAASYTCKTAGGELSWDANRRLLTIRGTVFIDGSAKIDNGAVNAYDGQGTLYLSGSLLAKNSKLCAVVKADRTGCDTNAWNPNAEALVVVTNGPGGDQTPVGTGTQLVSASFQGALYATNAISIDTTSQAIGPMIGSTVMLGQSVDTAFPAMSIAPPGMPSSAVVFAQPNSPQMYGG